MIRIASAGIRWSTVASVTMAPVERIGGPSHLSLAERREVGRGARRLLPRSHAGQWDRDGRGHDALSILLAQNATRVPELVPIRHGRMAASPWTYYRGAAAVMAADLASLPHTGLLVQMCGDAHVLNFGLWASPERQLSFDLRDFDETLPGPFEWDVMRMIASLHVLATSQAERLDRRGRPGRAGRVGRVPDVHRPLCRHPVPGHLVRPVHGRRPARPRSSKKSAPTVATRLAQTGAEAVEPRRRQEVHRSHDGQRRLVEVPPFRTRHDGADRALVEQAFTAYRSSLPEERRYLLDRYSLVDGLRQVVGVGSVGMRVYLLLLQGSHPDDLLFLQVKQAGPSVYEQHLEPSRYPNHGQRVTVGRRFIQSSTDILVGWTSLGGIDFYVRQFRDMKVIPSGERIAPWLRQFARKCGRVLARAHATTGDAAAIDAYLGRSDTFEESMTRFARAYASQNGHDHAQLVAAVRAGAVDEAAGW